MSTLDGRTYTSSFNGLKSTAITASVFLVLGVSLHEYMKRIRRYPKEDARRAAGEAVRDRGMEGYALGYLFRARAFVPVLPTPIPAFEWPLEWVYTTSWKLKEKFYEIHCGADATVYLRFLRGNFYWTLLHICTTFPVLLSINFILSSPEVSKASLERASLTSLTTSPTGKRLLWVHVLACWFLALSWYGTLYWIGYGTVRIRRNGLRALLRAGEAVDGDEKQEERLWIEERQAEDEQDRRPVGWRFKTVLVRNLPPALRTETALRQYFELHLQGKSTVDLNAVTEGKDNFNPPSTPPSTFPPKSLHPPSFNEKGPGNDTGPLINDVIIVRKESELNELFNKYRAVQHDLEEAHCALAKSVMAFVAAKVDEEERAVQGMPPKRDWTSVFKRRSREVVLSEEDSSLLVLKLRPFLSDVVAPLDSQGQPLLLWSVLHDLNQESSLLDLFQPLTKLKRFRNQKVPAIDYLLAKLNLLSTLIEDKRAHLEQFEPASSAFVTFSTASDARRARKQLKWRPDGKVFGGRVLECKVKMAPEVRDLDWNRLVYVSLSSDILRGALTTAFLWAATIFWVIPISFLVGLLSLDSIGKYIPKLATFLESNSVTQSLFSSLLPTAIVALLSMLVPTLIGILTRNSQALITVTKLHAEVQSRYWKWVVVNLLIVFCIGLSAFTAFLNAFRSPGSVLRVVADAFPKGATFFVSYSLLVIGSLHGFEMALFIIGWINHASIRKYKAPRKREVEAIPRMFNYPYWVPNHLLILSISVVFAILNPLVLAFNFFFWIFSLTTFKHQFARVYFRRHYENNGRFIFRRVFRYSLDMFTVAAVVAVALLYVLKFFRLGAGCIPLIPINVIIKIIGTRWFDHLMDELDELEVDIVCDEAASTGDLSVPLTEEDKSMHHLTFREVAGTIRSFAMTTLPALALRPSAKLPAVPSPAHNSTPIRPRRPSAAHKVKAPRPSSPSSLEASRPMLSLVTSHDSQTDESQDSHATPSPTLARRVVSPDRLDLAAFAAGDGTKAMSAFPTSLKKDDDPTILSNSPLISIHPPVIRDDRPVTNRRFDNPARVVPLTQCLWLPRDPLLPVDLGDTVDYFGSALVSSEGGNGAIGTWDECTVAEAEECGGEDKPHRQVTGTEQIRVAEAVAAKIEAEDGVQESSEEQQNRRRSSTVGSGGLSIRLPSMRRRGTGSSSVGTSVVPSPQGSPSHLRPGPPSPTLRRVSSGARPAIPVFTEEPDSMASEHRPPPPPTSHSSSSAISAYPFPSPRSGSLSRRDASPTTLSPPRAPRTRQGRSASLVPSIQPSIVEASHAEEVNAEAAAARSISQAQALRAELLHEAQEEQQKRTARETARREKEKRQESSWLSKLLVASAVEAEHDET